MNTAKKLLLGAVAASALLLVLRLTGAGPGGSLLIGSLENSGASSWKMSYLRFSGEKSRSIRLKAGETLNLSIQTETEEGSLVLLILQGEEEKARLQDGGQDSGATRTERTFSLKAEEDMQLTLCAQGERHRGGFSFTW